MHFYTLRVKYLKKKIISFAITSKVMKSLGVNLAKEVKKSVC